MPLFLEPLGPEPDDWVDDWTSAREWQVPGPLTGSLQRALADPGTEAPPHAPYPDAAGVPAFYDAEAGEPAEPAPLAEIWPESGQFRLASAPESPLTVTYNYGFSATVGAGAYDRTLLGAPPAAVAPSHPPVTGGSGLDAALAGAGGAGTITLADSRTYSAVADAGTTADPLGTLLVRAGADQRPVVRLPDANPPAAWVFTGGGPDSELVLDGLLVSGGDIVLRGAFASVRITACTADPGMLDVAGAGFAESVDGRPLRPVRIWIERDPGADADSAGAIVSLQIDRCILGPVRTRDGGAVETLAISDSILQGLAPRTADPAALRPGDVYDPELLAKSLAGDDPAATRVFAALPVAAQTAVTGYAGGPLAAGALAAIADGLDTLIAAPQSIYSLPEFAGVPLPQATAAMLDEERSGSALAELNRAVLEALFPVALSPAALAVSRGVVSLARTTVLGRTFVHRLRADDTILGDFTVADDAQDGCVRYSAVATGSSAGRRYRSVTLTAGAALCTSTGFGDPGYGQLLETVDRAIEGGTAGATISAGAQSGAEMGAFSSELATLRERGLLAKYGEFMPLGLTPVVLHVT